MFLIWSIVQILEALSWYTTITTFIKAKLNKPDGYTLIDKYRVTAFTAGDRLVFINMSKKWCR